MDSCETPKSNYLTKLLSKGSLIWRQKQTINRILIKRFLGFLLRTLEKNSKSNHSSTSVVSYLLPPERSRYNGRGFLSHMITNMAKSSYVRHERRSSNIYSKSRRHRYISSSVPLLFWPTMNNRSFYGVVWIWIIWCDVVVSWSINPRAKKTNPCLHQWTRLLIQWNHFSAENAIKYLFAFDLHRDSRLMPVHIQEMKMIRNTDLELWEALATGFLWIKPKYHYVISNNT